MQLTRPWPAKRLFHGDRQLLGKGKLAVRRDGHVCAADIELSRAEGIENGLSVRHIRMDFDVDWPMGLANLVEIDTAKGRCCSVYGTNMAKQLKRTGTWRIYAIVSPIPDFDAVEFRADWPNQIDAACWRVSQNRDSSRLVYTVDELLHI